MDSHQMLEPQCNGSQSESTSESSDVESTLGLNATD